MNKRGEENTLNFTISLLLTVIVFLIIGGCAYRYFSSQGCPAGYNLIQDVSHPEIFTFCGSLEAMEEGDYRCCQRKSDVTELCRYNLKKKEFTICRDLFSFDNLYGKSFTCQDEVPCGSGREDGKCAGVSCPENSVCLVRAKEGKKFGECVEEFILDEEFIGVVDDGVTPCGEFSGIGVVGMECSEREKRLDLRHCVFDMSGMGKIIHICMGNTKKAEKEGEGVENE